MEVRAVYRNQDQPILTRMMDKESHWGYDNGLQEIFLFSRPGYSYDSSRGRPILYFSEAVESKNRSRCRKSEKVR